MVLLDGTGCLHTFNFCTHLSQIETIFMGEKKISIRTSVLEEKATACNMLCCYADELREGFYPYVEQA